MTEASKSNPAPLDAYETAKPDEPIFTLQGGDPLAAPLVRLWAELARARTGLRPHLLVTMNDCRRTGSEASVAHDPKEVNRLLIRATEAEQISWLMDEYLAGGIVIAQDAEKHFDEFEKLDIYDIRRRCASAISNFFSELNDYREELVKHEFLDAELNNSIEGIILALRSIEAKIGISK